MGHLAVLGLLGAIFAEMCLLSFRKIPFTCSYLPGKSYFHMAVFAYIGVGLLIGKGAEVEQQALLGDGKGLMTFLVVLATMTGALRLWAARTAPAPEEIEFEETPVPAVSGVGYQGTALSRWSETSGEFRTFIGRGSERSCHPEALDFGFGVYDCRR